jgi:diaminopimelate epimerase
MKFWKMQGAGNDFVAFDARFDNIDSDNYNEIALKLCNRRFGVGSDGLLIVKDSETCDIEMVYYNSDGSRGEMCGNGIRCFSKFVYENNIVNKTTFTVDTLDGVKVIELGLVDKIVNNVKVDMGMYSLTPNEIPVSEEFNNEKNFINKEIQLSNETIIVSSLLMGVPHTVIFTDDASEQIASKYGREIENHKVFPRKTNANFVKIINKDNIEVYTWERGCGFTLGCGTGMTASVIVANLLGNVNNIVNVKCPGGEVKIDISDKIYMIGSAEKIFEGYIKL